MNKKKKKSILQRVLNGNSLFFFFLSIALVFVAYHNLFNAFYQQEEWIGVGYALTRGLEAFIPSYSVSQILTGQGRIMAAPINFLFYRYFPLNILPFVIFALVFHVANTYLVFALIRKISKSLFLAFSTGFFFAVASVSDQAILWPATVTTSLPAGFFSFLSLVLFTHFVQCDKRRYLFFSFASSFVAVLFKESSFFIFLLFPVIFILFNRKKISFTKIVKIHLPVIFYLAIVFLVKVLSSINSLIPNGVYTSTTATTWQKILFRLIFYPLESLSQIFIRGSFLYPATNVFLLNNYYRIWGTPSAGVVAETIGADMLSIFFSFIILIVIAYIFLQVAKLRRIILFGVFFVLFAFIPYIFIDKPTAYIESRHFYMSVVGAGLLFSVFFYFLRYCLIKYVKLSKIVSTIVVFFPMTIFMVLQIQFIHEDVNAQVQLASERKKFLKSLQAIHPTIPKKPIFYFTSDQDFYMPGNKVPFQHGFAYSLMILYYNTGLIPKELLITDFLWVMTDQGYKEINGKGVGYFWDLDLLKKEMHEKKLDIESLVAAYYNSNTMSLINISDDIRRDIEASISAGFTHRDAQ